MSQLIPHVPHQSFDAPATLVRYTEPVSQDEAQLRNLPTTTLQSGILTVQDVPTVTTTDKILNAVLPPREVIMDDGTQKLQYVNPQQISRPGLHDLQVEFEERLRASKARESGICPVRSAIYAMLMDELIRQVTIDNPERGLLLLRIRDELRLTLAAYKTLNECSEMFGKKKLVEGERGKPAMVETINKLTAERDRLLSQRTQLESKEAALVRCCKEQQQADEKRYAEERVFLERTKQRLEQQLETIKQMQEAERREMRGE